MPRKNSLSGFEKAEIRRLALAGMCAQDIARAIGRPRGEETVTRWCRLRGLGLNRGRLDLSDDEILQIEDLAELGFPATAIGKRLHRSAATIRYWCRRADITLCNPHRRSAIADARFCWIDPERDPQVWKRAAAARAVTLARLLSISAHEIARRGEPLFVVVAGPVVARPQIAGTVEMQPTLLGAM